MRSGLAVVAALAMLTQGCTGETLSPEDEVGIVRRNTPEGEAAIQLLVEPAVIQLGDSVTVRLVNRGEVDLLTGSDYSVHRWRGRWIRVRTECVSTLVGIGLPPGVSTEAQRWPNSCYADVEPGRYRILKSAIWEDGEHYEDNVRLQGRASFLVREGVPGAK